MAGDAIDLAGKLALITEHWRPGVVAEANGQKLAVVKLQGEFVWHAHEDADDVFLCLAGELTIQLRDRDVVLRPGQLFVVPAGVEHRPVAEHEAHVLLIEPAGTVNTGDAPAGDLTAPERRI